MSKLTKFEALQLAAAILKPIDVGNPHHPSYRAHIQKLFELAEIILEESQK